MITPENITRKQAKRLVKLIEQETRCEVMARLGPVTTLECIDYAVQRIEYTDKIRKMLFDESELVVLAEQWGMLKKGKIKRKKRVKRKS